MNRYFPNVFRPITIGNLEIKNRIEMAPAIPSLSTGDGYVTRELIEYHRVRARGGIGIVTVGDTAIDFDYGKDHCFQLNLGSDHNIAGLNTLAEAVHRYGSVVSIELTHPGRLGHQELVGGKDPLTPSPSPPPETGDPIAGLMAGAFSQAAVVMTRQHIDMLINQYAAACFRCLEAGFRMVMIHGAHGQLPAQFVSPYSNRRTDGYGGSLKNRARFVIELLDAVRARVGDRLAIEYRISADELIDGGMKVEDTIAFVKLIEDKIDLLHVSMGLLSGVKSIPRTIQPTYIPHGVNAPFAAVIKKAVMVPVAAVGSIDMEMADKLIGEGACDIVAMARANIADPDYVNKNRYGRFDEIIPCVRCNDCCTARIGWPVRCAVNPVTGRETEYPRIPRAESVKKVVVVGGGPAGMQAAITAASRGHRVTLLEKGEKLGGALNYAAALPFKTDMKRYRDWLVKKTENTPWVDIKLGTEGDPASIRAERPDALIVAAGAEPFIPDDIPGIDGPNVVWGGQVDTGERATGQNVVVAGAGLIGCETAWHLAQQGRNVTVIDVLDLPRIASDGFNKIALLQLMFDSGVKLLTETRLESVGQDGVTVVTKDGQREEIPADTVVISLGNRPRRPAMDELEELASEVYAVGDCVSARNLRHAVHDGFNIAVEL